MSIYGNPVMLSGGGGGGGGTLITKSISANGTYNASDDGADGYSSVTALVNGIRDNMLCNWDFADPVNSQGAAQYSSGGLIYSLNGWQLQAGVLDIVTGGILLSRIYTGTPGYFMQRYYSSLTSSFVGKDMTLTAIVDGVLGSVAVNMTGGSGAKGGTIVNGVSVRLYNYGSEVAFTIDIDADTGSHLIQAVKLEYGSGQTLATQIGGVWVLNSTMIAYAELSKISGMVYNS